MGKSVSLVVRLPIAVYDELKQTVDDKKLALSYSGFARQVIIEKLNYLNKRGQPQIAETSDNE